MIELVLLRDNGTPLIKFTQTKNGWALSTEEPTVLLTTNELDELASMALDAMVYQYYSDSTPEKTDDGKADE